MFQGYNKVIQVYINIFFFRFFSTLGYYKISNIVSCAVYSRPLFLICYTYSRVYLLIPNPYFILPSPMSPLW